MVLAGHLLSHFILTTTKDGPGLTKLILQRRKTEAQRGTRTKTRPHSLTCLQVQALPHGCTTCVCMFRHMHAFLCMCMFVWRCQYENVSVYAHENVFRPYPCMSSVEHTSRLPVQCSLPPPSAFQQRAGWKWEPFSLRAVWFPTVLENEL